MSAPRRIVTPMRRVRGLGAAGTGTREFWHQRVTSVAGIFLTIALIIIVMALMGRSHAAVALSEGRPVGVYIQHVAPGGDPVSASARFFDPREARHVAAGPDPAGRSTAIN